MEQKKRKLDVHSKSSTCTLEEDFDLENNEITFSGKITFKKDTKTNRRIMYLSLKNGTPAFMYFFNRKPLRLSSAETEELYEDIKEEYGVDLF